MLGYNMFAYCGNNPVVREDPSGDAFETIFDAFSLGLSIKEVIANPSDVWAWLGMAGDIADVAIPFVAGLGEAVRGVNAARKAVDIVDDAYDTAKATDNVFDAVGGLCFVAGTIVYTADGNRPIEEINPGDYVWAWDETRGDVALKEVVETYVNKTFELTHIYIGGEEIIATPTHPFYSPVKGWTDACQLRAGDILVLVNGEYVVVEKVQHEILEFPVKVYNFQVKDYHTYYVAEHGVLVHNKCSADSIGEHRIGTGSPQNNGTPNGSYTKITDSGEVYSYTLYNENSEQILRIDLKGTPHRGVLPHIHVYGYNAAGKRNLKQVYDTFWNLID